MTWTNEFDEILKGVLRRSDPSLLDSEEIAAISEIVEKGFEAVKNDEDVSSLLGSIDTSGLPDDEFEVVHYAQSLADEDRNNQIERNADIISSPDYLGLRDEGFSHEEAVARVRGDVGDGEPVTEAEVRQMADRLSANEAILSRLIADDDDENDPVPYEDEAADHKFAHPNYGGSENPDYQFFDVFRTAGQDEDIYCMDVPLPKSARELFEDEPESHVPSDPNQNYYRLEITIGDDGHPSLVRDGSEGDGLDEHLYDVYNASIRAGAERFALERGLIADNSKDADWDENDPVPHDEIRYPSADWGEISDSKKAVSAAEGEINFNWEGGRQFVPLVIPDDVLDEYALNNLKAVGLEIDDMGKYDLSVKVEDGEARLDRQFSEYSLQGEFEQALFQHYRSKLQALVDKEVAIAKGSLKAA